MTQHQKKLNPKIITESSDRQKPTEDEEIQELQDVAKRLQQSIPQLKSVSESKIIKALETGISAVSVFRQHRGPLPTPEDFANYEQILPGAANRILGMAEDALKSHTDSRKLILTTEKKRILRGQVFAFILAIFFLGSSLATILFKLSPYLSGSLGLVGLAPIIAGFLPKIRVKKVTEH